MNEASRSRDNPEVADLHKAAAQLYKVKVTDFDVDALNQKILTMPEKLGEKVSGHEDARAAMADEAAKGYARLREGRGPRAAVLLAGASPADQTGLAEAYAETLGLPLKVIDLSNYAAGMTPMDLKREIATSLRKNASTVFLFKKVELAHPAIRNALPGLLEDAVFHIQEQNGGGTRLLRVSGRNAHFLFSTEAGSEFLNQPKPETDPKLFPKAVEQDGIPPALVTQTKVIPIRPRGESDFRQTVAFKLRNKLQGLAAKQGLIYTFENQDAFVDRIVKEFHSEGKESPNIDPILNEALDAALAKAKLRGDLHEGAKIKLEYEAALTGSINSRCIKIIREAL